MPNQIKTCPHSGNMKILIIVLVCVFATLVRGSLEPAGYRPPGTYLQARYLPPSSSNDRTDNRYVSSTTDLASRHFGAITSELSRGLTLPLQTEPVPFSNYLPANRQSTDRNDHQSVVGERWTNVFPRFNPTTEIQRTFDQAIPSNDYLPPGQRGTPFKHYSSPANNNRATADGRSADSYASLAGRNHVSTNDKSKVSVYRPDKFGDTGSDKHSASYENRQRNHYLSPENHTPAKYEFEYEVKDNYGNDYGHKEIRNGENTQGVYKVLLPDGRRQIVHYEADSHGYRPTITYEEADTSSITRQSLNHNNQGYQY